MLNKKHIRHFFVIYKYDIFQNCQGSSVKARFHGPPFGPESKRIVLVKNKQLSMIKHMDCI